MLYWNHFFFFLQFYNYLIINGSHPHWLNVGFKVFESGDRFISNQYIMFSGQPHRNMVWDISWAHTPLFSLVSLRISEVLIFMADFWISECLSGMLLEAYFMDVVNVDDVFSLWWQNGLSPHLSWRSHFARPRLESWKPFLNVMFTELITFCMFYPLCLSTFFSI